MLDFIRVDSDEQISQLVVLASDIWHEHYEPIIGIDQVRYMLDKFQSASAISRQIAEGYEYYAMVDIGVMIGYISFLNEGSKLFISKYYIASSGRGKGYGRAAMAFIEECARNNSIKELYLTVNKYNANSIAVYKKLGFEITEELVTDIGNGYVMDDYKFTKILA